MPAVAVAPPPPPAPAPAPPADPAVLLAGRLLGAQNALPSPDTRDPLQRAVAFCATMNALTDGLPPA
jgi:hypothetical protein